MRYPRATVDLDGAEQRALASFYARRFPRRADRLRLAHAAGVGDGWTDFSEPEAAWESLVSRAHAAGLLPKLAEVAGAERPADENLGELARTLRAAGKRSPVGLLAAAAAGLLVGLFIGIPVGRSSVPTPIVLPPPPAPVAAPEPAPEEEEAPESKAPPAEPLTNEDLPEVVPFVPSPVLPEGCKGEVGSVVGYWFAGTTDPGKVGYAVTMDKAIRVRADYPRAENSWNSSAEVRCVLPPGLRVNISQAPIAVEGGGWWVPLIPEDVR